MTDYIVTVRWDDGAFSTEIKTPYEIINMIDMSDCYLGVQYRVYRSDERGIEELNIHGCWHDFNDPLYIKLIDSDGNVEIDGYGTDH